MALRSKNYQKAFDILKPLADHGDSTARLYLAHVYLSDDLKFRDVKLGFDLLHVLAANGDARADGNLATIYQNLKGGVATDTEALKWAQAGAEKDDPESELVFSVYILRGIGVPKDPRQAERWLIKSAEQGFPDALFSVSAQYFGGFIVPKDGLKYIFWEDVAQDRAMLEEATRRADLDEIYRKVTRNLTNEQLDKIAQQASKWHPGKGALASVWRDAGLEPANAERSEP